eukprot:405832-Pyramimonas_sp.AAC.1
MPPIVGTNRRAACMQGHFTDNYADQAPYFHSHKDIAIPGRLDTRKAGLLYRSKPQAQRTTLGIFYGTHQVGSSRLLMQGLDGTVSNHSTPR